MEIAKMEISLKNCYISSIYKQTGCTYSHVGTLVYVLQDKKLITIKKSGRCVNICLTQKGKAVAHHLFKLKEIVDING